MGSKLNNYSIVHNIIMERMTIIQSNEFQEELNNGIKLLSQDVKELLLDYHLKKVCYTRNLCKLMINKKFYKKYISSYFLFKFNNSFSIVLKNDINFLTYKRRCKKYMSIIIKNGLIVEVLNSLEGKSVYVYNDTDINLTRGHIKNKILVVAKKYGGFDTTETLKFYINYGINTVSHLTLLIPYWNEEMKTEKIRTINITTFD